MAFAPAVTARATWCAPRTPGRWAGVSARARAVGRNDGRPVSVNLSINEETAQRILTAAILESLDTDARNQIIAQAVAWLGEPRADGYGRDKTTPLQDAFRMAMDRYVNIVVREVIEADETLKAQIDSSVRDFIGQWSSAIEKHGPELQTRIVETVTSFITEQTRY